METLNRQTALELFASLNDALEMLKASVRVHCRSVLVYELPTIDAEDCVPARIPVTRWGSSETLDQEALEKACAALTHFHLAAGQKSTTTFRLPGVLTLTDDVSDQVRRVNEIKDRLQSHLLAAYPDTVGRSRICKRLFPGLHMNHVYRHVHVVPDNIRRLNFTWQCQTPADVWITPGEAIEMTQAAIEDELKHTPSTSQDRDRLKALEIALQVFSRLPETTELSAEEVKADPGRIPFQLVKRNHVRAHPRVQMFDPQQGRRPLHTHAANLPLLALPSATHLDVRDLKDHEPGRSRKRSDTKQGFEEISQVLHIYGGYPTVDHYLRRLRLQQHAQTRKRRISAV